MKLLLIRHGESEADRLGVHEGRTDFSLTEEGMRQAAAMAAFVSEHYEVTKIYASPLRRAKETAEALSFACGVPVKFDEHLMEFNNGLLAGLSRSDAEEKYPAVPDLPVHRAVYEQESVLEFRFRADWMLSELLSTSQSEDTVAVITHGGMINQLLRSFLRLPVESDVFFRTGDTGIHELVVNEYGRAVLRLNETSHIENLD